MGPLLDLAESGRVPPRLGDRLIRLGIRQLLAQRLREEHADDPEAAARRAEALLASLRESPIAIETAAANAQHYEVPAAFFRAVLGRHLKYSCGLWDPGTAGLDEAEAAMLHLTAERAGLANGQRVLELGCGWGSLSLWLAERHPNSRIVAVSNSASQRAHIEAEAARRGLSARLEVRTADVNRLALEGRFDRVVSVEMFEHVRNYASLLERIAGWLEADGRLFVHIFCHRHLLYPFETEGDDNWMGRHFFSGGLMPAADTLLHFQDHLRLERRWLVSGEHYAKTARAWLDRLDADPGRARTALDDGAPPAEVDRRLQRWRIFFMACEELFAYRGGAEWLVGHYAFAPRAS